MLFRIFDFRVSISGMDSFFFPVLFPPALIVHRSPLVTCSKAP